MSQINFVSKMLYGADGTQLQRSQTDDKGSRHGESITATTRRAMRGPSRGGRIFAHVMANASCDNSATAGSTLVGTLETWYSSLPNPSTASDADWVKDTASSATLTVTTGSFTGFLAVGNVLAEWVMFKLVYTSGTGALVVWARCEGDQ